MPPYRVELSLNMTLLLAVGLIAVSYGLLRLLAATLNLPHEVAVFQRRKKAAHCPPRAGAIVAGVLGRPLPEGRARGAARLRNEQSPENQGVALLLAARAATPCAPTDRRDGYLAQRMDSLGNGLQLARRMLEAELLLDENARWMRWRRWKPRAPSIANLTAALRLELKIRQLQSSPSMCWR